MLHVALANMARKYGPIMYLNVGTCGMVVASTPNAAKAFLKMHEKSFLNRPVDSSPTYLAYNAQYMVFAEYGPKWTMLRKLCSLNMLGLGALESWPNVRAMEVGICFVRYEEMSRSLLRRC